MIVVLLFLEFESMVMLRLMVSIDYGDTVISLPIVAKM